ncbi:uncharacterized protein LOC110999318 isoform X2 [Pieris rapae]|uniref:uncharacterized protein LOC110999318 isoform X2 n=1 Tax=Pieris rapae TaxID=64459 RepID=UPI001E280C11|nr:uncharacterized protein LOC110999318 isoform X2 [Pieris rapae]
MKNDDSENDDSSNFSFHLEKKGQSSYLNNINKLTSSTLDRYAMGKGMNQEKFYDCTSVPRVSHKEDFCHVKLDTIHKLKDSTKKLLHILEQINAKTRKKLRICDDTVDNDGVVQPKSLLGISASQLNVSDIVPNEALVRLELQTRIMKNITIDYEDDDCSVYKRLTRKCNCMNNINYNDLVIHFNENTKYTTNSFGEIVKNMRILKKFLYMGGEYTKNALMFLNEGLLESKVPEKIEIINGCTNADICGIFDEHSIVIVCISWPCKNEYFGDSSSQPVEKKNEAIQMPPKKNSKKTGKSMKGLGASPVKLLNLSRRKITDWEPAKNFNRSRKFSKVTDWEPSNKFNQSRKFSKDMRSSIIVVPIEK